MLTFYPLRRVLTHGLRADKLVTLALIDINLFNFLYFHVAIVNCIIDQIIRY